MISMPRISKIIEPKDELETIRSYKDCLSLPRSVVVKKSLQAHKSDKNLASMIKEADKAQREKNNHEAENNFRKIVNRYPFHMSYWVQLGHAQKDQGKLIDAEISYRNSFALGNKSSDLLEHLSFVVSSQGLMLDLNKAPNYNEIYESPPFSRDIELLFSLFMHRHPSLNNETISVMRASKSLKESIVNMLNLEEFANRNVDMLTTIKYWFEK